jgi:hypothetical protein
VVFALSRLAKMAIRLRAAAVSAIPITAAIVVLVVAVAISTPPKHLAFAVTAGGHGRIVALTLGAEAVLVLSRGECVPATVSTVPVATANIVIIVAMPISLPLMHGAVFCALGVSMDKVFI